MKQAELIEYWVSSSKRDYRTMMNLYNSKDYHWSLFLGHLVIEKLLKAIFIQRTGKDNPPRTPDLLLLCEKASVSTDARQKDSLDLITTFNISARYPDYKNSFYNKCTKSFTAKNIGKIKELRTWLTSVLESK